MSQKVYPTADTSNTDWVSSPTPGQDLYAQVNNPLNVSKSMECLTGPTPSWIFGATAVLVLDSPPDLPAGGTITLRVYIRQDRTTGTDPSPKFRFILSLDLIPGYLLAGGTFLDESNIEATSVASVHEFTTTVAAVNALLSPLAISDGVNPFEHMMVNAQFYYPSIDNYDDFDIADIYFIELVLPDGAPPMPWWTLDWDGPFNFSTQAATQPADYELKSDVFAGGVFFPSGSLIAWTSIAAPDDNGWWLSIDDNFAGAAYLLDDNVPRNPRDFTEIASFAASSTGMMGGFPGPCCVLNNTLVYAKGGYTVGTDAPPIHVFDGTFDRVIATAPETSSEAVPKAIMTMLAANGTVYFTTLDSGADSTDWAGRIFSLDLITGNVTEIGAGLPAGHVPYALAWYMGRLWIGTHRQSSSAYGKIYYFRPGIDTAWVEDKDLTTATLNVTSMLSYKGLLYVGTSGPSGTFAKVLVRGTDTTYTTSDTGSGGTAKANNAFLALAEFDGNLYASFWNPDTTAVSKIRKFDNSSWSDAYVGATTTLVPFLAFPQDQDTLFAIGGGLSYDGTLLETGDGSTWHDRTAFLGQSTTASTALPVFGVVVR